MTSKEPSPFDKENVDLVLSTADETLSHEKNRIEEKSSGQEGRNPGTQEPRNPTTDYVERIYIDFDPEPPEVIGDQKKMSFELSKQDGDLLDELKFVYRDLKITKFHIIRTGLELIRRDHESNGENCYLARKFAPRNPGTQEPRKVPTKE